MGTGCQLGAQRLLGSVLVGEKRGGKGMAEAIYFLGRGCDMSDVE